MDNDVTVPLRSADYGYGLVERDDLEDGTETEHSSIAPIEVGVTQPFGCWDGWVARRLLGRPLVAGCWDALVARLGCLGSRGYEEAMYNDWLLTVHQREVVLAVDEVHLVFPYSSFDKESSSWLTFDRLTVLTFVENLGRLSLCFLYCCSDLTGVPVDDTMFFTLCFTSLCLGGALHASFAKRIFGVWRRTLKEMCHHTCTLLHMPQRFERVVPRTCSCNSLVEYEAMLVRCLREGLRSFVREYDITNGKVNSACTQSTA